MSLPVLVEPLANQGFRATSGAPLALSVEAPTREEALARLQGELQKRLKDGAQVVSLDLGAEPHPWMEFAGMYDPDDSEVKAWEKAVAEHRRTIDRHPELP